MTLEKLISYLKDKIRDQQIQALELEDKVKECAHIIGIIYDKNKGRAAEFFSIITGWET